MTHEPPKRDPPGQLIRCNQGGRSHVWGFGPQGRPSLEPIKPGTPCQCGKKVWR